MIKRIIAFFGFTETAKSQSDFSLFFHDASSAEKKKLLLEVVKEANKDQQKLINKYNQTFRHSAQ